MKSEKLSLKAIDIVLTINELKIMVDCSGSGSCTDVIQPLNSIFNVI